MTQSSLTNQVRPSFQQSSRLGAIVDTFLIHHQAGTNDDATIQAMVSGSRQVSANYTIASSGRLTLVVDETARAFTSGSSADGGKGAAWDRRSITVEISNSGSGPDWPISDAAITTAARLLLDLQKRYPIRNVLGHRDLWNNYRASYSTYCPGPNTVARIVARANELRGTIPAVEDVAALARKKDSMYIVHSIKDDTATGKGPMGSFVVTDTGVRGITGKQEEVLHRVLGKPDPAFVPLFASEVQELDTLLRAG